MNGKSWYAIIRRGQSWYVSTATNLRGLGRMMILQIENLLYRFLTSLFRRWAGYPSRAGRRPLEAWCMSFSFRIFLP